MNAGLVVQYAVIALLVAVSAAYTLRRLAPALTTRWQAGVAGRMLKPGRGAFVQHIGRALQPRTATGNCGDGCSTCCSCGTDTAAPREDGEPVTFHPSHRQ